MICISEHILQALSNFQPSDISQTDYANYAMLSFAIQIFGTSFNECIGNQSIWELKMT